MKKSLLLFTLLITTVFCFGQNLIVNGDFESPGMDTSEVLAPWGGFKNRIITDTILNTFVGQVENGDGSLFQEFAVTAGETYDVSFNYKWVDNASTNSTMNVRVKDAAVLSTNLDLVGGTTANAYKLETTADQWFNNATFSFVPPEGVTEVRLLFFKGNGNKPLNLDDVSVALEVIPANLNELDKFEFKAFPNPAQDFINLSATSNIDRVEIFSLLGQQVMDKVINSTQQQVNISGLSKGVYMVKTYIGESVGSYKLVKE